MKIPLIEASSGSTFPPIVLRTVKATAGRLCKKWIGTPDHPVCQSYDFAYWHTLPPPDTCKNLGEFHDALVRLSKDTSRCVVRGAPKPNILRNAAQVFRRTLDNFAPDDTGPLWACLDFDTPPPKNADILLDPAGYVQQVAMQHGLLGVPAVFQFSASAGVKLNKSALHFWVPLSKPLPLPVLKLWYESLGADASLASLVQPHYTAAPLFEAPMVDPFDTAFPRLGLSGWDFARTGDAVRIDSQAILDTFGRQAERAAIQTSRDAALRAAEAAKASLRPPTDHATCLQVAEYFKIVTDVALSSTGETLCDCPRHVSESKTSLRITEDGDRWWCFGCQDGGGAWKLAEWCLAGSIRKPESPDDLKRAVVLALRAARGVRV